MNTKRSRKNQELSTNQADGSKITSSLDITSVTSQLNAGGVPGKTVDFLEQSLASERDRLLQAEQHAKDHFLISSGDGTNAVSGLGSAQSKPFLENHAAQVPQKLSKNLTKKASRQWNTGTRDLGKYTDRLNDLEDKVNGSMLLMEKSKIQINKHAQKNRIGEAARYAQDSEKSESPDRPSQGLSRPVIQSQKSAMKSRIAREEAEFDKFLSCDEEEDFDREMRRIEEEKLAERNAERKTFEPDLAKWEGTGLEDELLKGHCEPGRRLAGATAKERAEASTPEIEEAKGRSFQYTNPVDKRKRTKVVTETDQRPQNLADSAPKILTGPPSLRHISQTSNMANNLNIQRPEPLFSKSGSAASKKVAHYMTLDGPVPYEPGPSSKPDIISQGALSASYSSLSSHLKASETQAKLREWARDKIHSLSRFYVIKGAEQLLSHYTHNKERMEQINQEKWKAPPGVKVYAGAQGFPWQDISEHQIQQRVGRKLKQGTSLTQFGSSSHQNQQSQSAVPLVKEWFESLSPEDRVLAVTTIDSTVVAGLRHVFARLKKTPNNETGRFKRITTAPTATTSIEVISKDGAGAKERKKQEQQPRPLVNYTFQLCNSQAHRPSHEKVQAELELLSFVRFTDTYELHDTLTMQEDLLRDPKKFYELAEIIAGELYLRVPHDVRWLGEGEESAPFGLGSQLCFESQAPRWFEMPNPNSLAAWILYYIERALFIQWRYNVAGEFLSARDQNKQPVFIGSEGKSIAIKNELRPFWRTFCEEKAATDEGEKAANQLFEAIRSKALQEYGVAPQIRQEEAKKIDSFHGGLSIYSEAEASQRHMVAKIDRFISKLKLSIDNFEAKDTDQRKEAICQQIDFKSICINTLNELIMVEKLNENDKCHKNIGKRFCFEIQTQRGPHTISVTKNAVTELEQVIDMQLERIFIDELRDHINQKLKSRYTSSNKTLQKKKLKKLKQKKLQEEKEREEKERAEQAKKDEQAEKQANVNTDRINVKNDRAIELLIGKCTTGPDEFPQKEFNLDEFQEIIQNKKSKKANKHKVAAKKDEKDRKVIISDGIVEKGRVHKSSTPEQKKELPKNQQEQISGGKVDPHNYFQVFGHKYASSLESQGGHTSQQSSSISGLGLTPIQLSNQNQPAGLESSRCGTIKTTSTCVESKQTQEPVQNSDTEFMSNQDVLIYQSESIAANGSRMGNSMINRKQWQRNSTIRGLVNDLISEVSSNKSNVDDNNNNYNNIREQIMLDVRGNIIIAELNDDQIQLDTNSEQKQANSSSESSIGPQKQIITLKKKKPSQARQIPYRSKAKVSDSGSSSDSEGEAMIPDVYTNYILQPEQNDSSDYGGESGQVGSGDDESEESVLDENSSRKQISQTKTSKKHVGGSREEKKRKSKVGKVKGKSAKKSTKSAHLKINPIDKSLPESSPQKDFIFDEKESPIEEQKPQQQLQIVMKANKNKRKKKGPKKPKIDFYNNQQASVIDNLLNESEAVVEETLIKNRWTQIKVIPAITCQRIEKSKEMEIEFVTPSNPKKNKKNKKQKKADWESKYLTNLEDAPIQQIEIIKPVIEVKGGSKVKEQVQQKNQNQNKDGNEKVKKQKKKDAPVSSAEAMNSFMKKLASKPNEHPIIKAQHQTQSNMQQPFQQQQEKQQDPPSQQQQAKLREDRSSPSSPSKQQQSKGTEISKETHVLESTNQNEQQKSKSYETQVKQQFKQKGSQIIHQSNPQQRLTMMEEAQKLGSGYRYEAKKPSPTVDGLPAEEQKSSTQKADQKSRSPKEPELAQVIKTLESDQQQKIIQKQLSFGGLSLQSKEYKFLPKDNAQPSQQDIVAEESKEQSQPVAVSEKPIKKQKKQRSNKNKRKKDPHRLPGPWINQDTGEEVYPQMQGDGSMMQQNHAIINQLAQGMMHPDGVQGSQNQPQANMSVQHLNFNQQVQDLLVKLSEQAFAQQQQQIQNMQMKQQQEAENLIQEQCEPCQEINSERYELFFEQLESEMKAKVKEIDVLKDSVRKERQGFISIVENIVKNTFSNKHGNGYVGIKIFGSMATELAIETSDVDLVVTGINSIQGSQHQQTGYGREPYGSKNQLLKMMQKLYDNLNFLKDKGQIHKIKFIQGANVPIIKLVVDLQVINHVQIEKAIEQFKRDREEDQQISLDLDEASGGTDIDIQGLGLGQKQIDQKMRYLKVDISIDEQSQQYLKHDNGSKQSHSGIDTIYHIQELVLQRKDLRPIVMIIKKIFDETFLSMPYFGGISSYSLVLMVSAYLKKFDQEKGMSLSQNLAGFFHFYGVGFKPHLFFLNGDMLNFCENTQLRPCQDAFIVLDPLDCSNNIAHSTFRIKDIQRALVQAFKIINETCERFQIDETDIQSKPRQVLERLMTEIREQYGIQQNIYDDDF